MNKKETEKRKKLSKLSGRAQNVRGEMAILQDKLFTQISNKKPKESPESYVERIKELISKWIKQHENSINGIEPVQVDLKKFYSDVHADRIENNRERNESEKFIKKILKKVDEQNGEIYQYLWISHRKDGMVVTVGKTTRKQDDLFGKLQMSEGTEDIILRVELGNEIISCFNEQLAEYLKWGWVIPIKNKIDGEDGETVRSLEKSLGDYLITNDVPILNFYSHRF